MNVHMTFETNERAAEIDRLLAVNCQDKYDVSYKAAGTPEHLTKKTVLVRFAATKDRERFRNVLRVRAGQDPIVLPVIRSRSLLARLFGH